MSAYRGSTGTSMGFARICKHRWGRWTDAATRRWRNRSKSGQDDYEDIEETDGQVIQDEVRMNRSASTGAGSGRRHRV
jgi:hypothetical protein